jgi:hypothetical protein
VDVQCRLEAPSRRQGVQPRGDVVDIALSTHTVRPNRRAELVTFGERQLAIALDPTTGGAAV